MNKKVNIFFWWGFWIIYLEMIYRFFVLKNLFSLNTLSIFLFSTIFILLFYILTNLFNNKANKILNIFFSCFLAILFLAQIVYYKFYSSMFSIFSLTAGGIGQVSGFISIIIRIIISIWYVFILVLIPIILFIIFRNKFEYKLFNNKKVYYLSSISLLLIICLLFYFDKSQYSYKKLFFKTNAPLLTINKTGLLTMETIDIYRFINGFNDKIEINEKINKVEYNSDSYNVIDIDFNSLIQKEKDENVINMHKYFYNMIPTKKNEYTGLLKNKNIIFINAESFDSIAVDEKLTPTLYKMVNNSFVFNNYYQPLYPISTYDGEYMNLTSLLPKEGTWSLRKISDNNIPFVFGNMFKNNNYDTYAFHNYNYNFYEREKSHPKYGFKYIACGNGLENKMNCDNFPNSDLEMIEATKEYLNNRFAIYYLTMSGHLDYNFKSHYISVKNKEKVKETSYSNKVKAYISSQIEFDKAMEKLLEELNKKNILDDTLIVISPDHYPYGLMKKELNEISEKDRSDKFENHHTTLIMYNPNIKKTIIDKYIMGIDIIPTIYNLFGFEYDSRLIMGKDIFSDEEGLVILSDRSWITSKGSYDSINDKFISFSDNKIDNNYIKKINKIVDEKFTISSMIIENDYYGKLGL